MIYLDNAATTWPKPEPVYREMDRFFRRDAGNPGRAGHRLALAAGEAVERTRLALARLFGVPGPERIVFCANATDALNIALKGLLGPGDHVVTSVLEHNSVLRPLTALERRGVTTTRVAVSPQGGIDPEEIRRAVGARTRMIVTTHISNVTGTIQPIAEIGNLARERGLLYLVDGAQSAGTLPLALPSLPVDLFAFTGHKGLFGPPGTGGLYIGPRVDLERFATLREGGTGIRSEEDFQTAELPYRFECGTPNTVGLAGLGTGVAFLAEVGVEKVREREVGMMEALLAGLRGIAGLTLYGPAAARDRGAIVSFTIRGWQPADVAAVLEQRYGVACRTGLHCAPGAIRAIGAWPCGTIRLSPGYFTTAEQIDHALDGIARIAAVPAL